VPCSSISSNWKILKGRCESSKCAQFCVDEGNYTGGYCKGRRIRECVCSNKDCAAGGGKGKPAPGGGAVQPPPPGNGAPGGGKGKPAPTLPPGNGAPGGGKGKPVPVPAPGGGAVPPPPPGNGGGNSAVPMKERHT
jgi:hypothetical protein